MTTWTKVPKPTLPQAFSGGEPIGLLLILTQTTITAGSPWTKVTKPSTTNWTKVPKAT